MAKAIKFANNTYLDSTGSVLDKTKLDLVFDNLSQFCVRKDFSYSNGSVPSSTAFKNYYTVTNKTGKKIGGIMMIYIHWAANSSGNRGIGLRSGNTHLITDQRPACTNGNTTRQAITYPLFLSPEESVYIDMWQDSGVNLQFVYLDIKFLSLSTEAILS